MRRIQREKSFGTNVKCKTMLKQVTKWCVFENDNLIDAFSTKEQAEFKAEKLQKEYMEFCKPTHKSKPSDIWLRNTYYHYTVREDTVNVFVE